MNKRDSDQIRIHEKLMREKQFLKIIVLGILVGLIVAYLVAWADTKVLRMRQAIEEKRIIHICNDPMAEKHQVNCEE